MMYRITIGTDERYDGQQIIESDRQNGIDEICTCAAHWFGGFTRYDGQGGWVNPNGRVVTERVITLAIACDESCGAFLNSDDTAPDDTIIRFARWAGWKLGQHSVVVELPAGEVRFIECQ